MTELVNKEMMNEEETTTLARFRSELFLTIPIMSKIIITGKCESGPTPLRETIKTKSVNHELCEVCSSTRPTAAAINSE